MIRSIQGLALKNMNINEERNRKVNKIHQINEEEERL